MKIFLKGFLDTAHEKDSWMKIMTDTGDKDNLNEGQYKRIKQQLTPAILSAIKTVAHGNVPEAGNSPSNVLPETKPAVEKKPKGKANDKTKPSKPNQKK